MRISAVRAHPAGAPLRRPFAFSQWLFTHRETLIVEVETAEGITGWGEAYGPAKPNAAAVMEFFAPKILGRDPRDTEDLWQFLFARSLDYGQKGTMLAALSALDIAFWDIRAKDAGRPLYRALGAARQRSVRCYATGFYPPREDDGETAEARFEAEAAQYRAMGFRAAKMKVGFGLERDVHLVETVRRALGEEIRLMIDANHAYDPITAVALARRVEQQDIGWFEEPVSPLDMEGYLEVKRGTTIPIAGGECEATRFAFEPWLRRRAFDYAQPDLCACGGISEGMKIATLASAHSVHVTPHAWGSAIGQAAALHFYAARPRHPGSLTPEEKWIECDSTENPFRTEIVAEPVRFEAGEWLLPEAPGLGVEIDRDALKRFAL